MPASFRQREGELTRVVREVSRGLISPETDEVLRSLHDTVHEQPPVHLFATNYDVDICNEAHLQKSPGRLITITGQDEGVCRFFEKLCPVSKILKLKFGVPVIVCQTQSKFLCIGRMGIVRDVNNETISVAFGTQTHEIRRATFTFKGISGIRVQFPLRLAFALTVHRAQGLTLNNVTVHADKMTAPGQLGVALGRAKSKEGLRVLGYSNSLMISQHPAEVEEFYKATDASVCSCLDSLDMAYLSQSSQETLSACESSQDQPPVQTEFNEEQVKVNFSCPEPHPDTKYARKYSLLRNKLLETPQKLHAFISYMSKRLRVVFEEAVGGSRITNRKQTQFFAQFHDFLLSSDYREQVEILFGTSNLDDQHFTFAMRLLLSGYH